MNGKTRNGFSLMEMLIVVAILAIIASASVPVAEISYTNSKEDELLGALESMREAIALWRRDCRNAVVAQYGYDKLNKVPYCNLCPPSLESLVYCRLEADGHYYIGDSDVPVDVIATDSAFNREARLASQIATFTPKKYLDKIPEDPFVGRPCWLIHTASGKKGIGNTTEFAAYGLRENETKAYSKAALASGTLYSDEGLSFVGVFDVSCIPSNAVDSDDYYTRRGYNISVDGTLYEDW